MPFRVIEPRYSGSIVSGPYEERYLAPNAIPHSADVVGDCIFVADPVSLEVRNWDLLPWQAFYAIRFCSISPNLLA